MDQRIDTMHLFDDPFTGPEVQLMCSKLPFGKAPGIDLVMYEHLKYGGALVHGNIATLLNEMVKCSKVARQLNIGLLFPAHKGKRKSKSEDTSIAVSH